MNTRFVRRFVAVAVFLLAGTLILPIGRGTSAHSDEGEEARLQGSWRVTVTLHNCQTGAPIVSFPSLLTFAAGHTLTEVTSSLAFLPGQRTPGLGTWSRTGDHTFTSVSDAFILFPSVSSPPGFKRGVQRINLNIDVNGDNFTANASNQFFDTHGVQYDTGCATVAGQRF